LEIDGSWMSAFFSPGQQLRNITIEKLLGEGGMGSVWKGQIAMVKKQLAVKVMHPKFSLDAEFRSRFLQEAEAMAQLNHDRIVPLNDFFHDEASGILALVMPFYEGETLEDLLEKTPRGLPAEEAHRYSQDILGALHYAHERGIVHRDIKPSNIFITREGKALLMDFGIAKVLSDVQNARLTRTGSMIGTPLYMSPEQILEPNKLDRRADVYSFGCVLYQMLTGRPPFLPDDTLMTSHVSVDPAPPREWNASIPPATEAAILQALAKRKQDRFESCADFAQALAASETAKGSGYTRTIVGRPGTGTLVETPPPPPKVENKPAPPLKRGNLAVKIAAGAVLAVGAAVGGWFSMREAPDPPGHAAYIEAVRLEQQSQFCDALASIGRAIDEDGNNSTYQAKRRELQPRCKPPGEDDYQQALRLKAAGGYCEALAAINRAVKMAPTDSRYTIEAAGLNAACKKVTTNEGPTAIGRDPKPPGPGEQEIQPIKRDPRATAKAEEAEEFMKNADPCSALIAANAAVAFQKDHPEALAVQDRAKRACR
jgi:tRNA A-37 threonylcarbamoyl transferase component Bud32